MKQIPPTPTALRVADLSQNTATAFALRPDAEALSRIASDLELLGLRKLAFQGTIVGEGDADWRLNATLGATVIQPCGVTLEPVTTRVDVPVTRLFQHGFAQEDAPEIEMHADETIEPLGKWIDPAEVMVEALVLALPLYPRIEGAALDEKIFAEPGIKPMSDEDARPFAGLASLKDQLGRDDTSES